MSLFRSIDRVSPTSCCFEYIPGKRRDAASTIEVTQIVMELLLKPVKRHSNERYTLPERTGK